ncbi:DUF418 domain-containing protein [Streptomyces sp. NPDC055287]
MRTPQRTAGPYRLSAKAERGEHGPGLGARHVTQQSWAPVLMFILGAIVFAAIWSRFFRRGPLEYLLNAATNPAKHIR